MQTAEFYDHIADVYHLIYTDWEQSIQRQAGVLDSAIRARFPKAESVLDVSCGIGTQSLGLAELGYRVTASDISSGAVQRAQKEAVKRGVDIQFTVSDLRDCDSIHSSQFDVVLSADNSIPHLLSDEDILAAFKALFGCTRSGGLTLISVRDYANEDRSPVQMRPYGVRQTDQGRMLILQLWEFKQNTDLYDLTMYFILEPANGPRTVIAAKSRYYAVNIARLTELLVESGFIHVERIDDRFFQPLLVARKPNP